MRKWTQIKLYTGKHEKPTDENIMRLLMPSILGMLVCMVCLFGSTWAWFTAGIQADGGETATAAANFSADVTVREISGATVQTIAAIQSGESGRTVETQSNKDAENTSDKKTDESLNEGNWKTIKAEDTDGMDFELKADTAYAVRIRAAGSATVSGYVVISDGEQEYYTVDMQSADAQDGNGNKIEIAGTEKTIEFFVIPEKDAVYHFTPVWGEYEGTSRKIRIRDGSVFGNGNLPAADETATDGDEQKNGDNTKKSDAENGSVSDEQTKNDSDMTASDSDETGSKHDGTASASGSDGNSSGAADGSASAGENEEHDKAAGADENSGNHGNAAAGTDSSGAE